MLDEQCFNINYNTNTCFKNCPLKYECDRYYEKYKDSNYYKIKKIKKEKIKKEHSE